jgi:predicted amidohydrolase
MTNSLRVACLQLNSKADILANLTIIAPLLAEARHNGAELIALPENATFIGGDDATRLANAKTEETHPAIPFFKSQAQQLQTWILCGSLTIKRPDGKLNNRSYLFSPDGHVAATYDKIHLFDAALAGGEHYRESDTVAPGEQAVLTTTPFGNLGLTICYDMRFGTLYRDLAKAGASIIAAPAAFTVPTGQAHWHSLLRTRAIESACFIIAPAQCGTHEGGRRTFGHSLIIDPWGAIMAEAADEVGIIYADLNFADIARVRKMLPSLQHDRIYQPPQKTSPAQS